MRSVLCPAILVCALASPALAGGFDIGAADLAFDPCAQPLPSRDAYLKTVVGPDADAVYDLQLKYHLWLCDGTAGPAILDTPRLVSYPLPPRHPSFSDDSKLHFVFPGDKGPNPSPVPLPGTGGILSFAMSGLGLLRAKRKTQGRAA